MIQDTHVSLDASLRAPLGGAERNGHVCCVFSTPSDHPRSRGTTLRGEVGVHYWLVRQVGENAYGVRGLDGEFLPFGTESRISLKELLEHYTPEAHIFESRLLVSARQHNFRLVNQPGRGLTSSRSILCVDEANVRGLFELALAYIKSGRKTRGRALVREIIRFETEYPGKGQFLFNEFGIRLRKAGFMDGAVICYRRALKFTDQDDHLYYNLARAYYHQGQWWDCMGALADCFGINPELPLARQLVVLINALADNAGLRAKYDKPPVPDGVARRAALLMDAVFTCEPSFSPGELDWFDGGGEQEVWLPGREAESGSVV